MKRMTKEDFVARWLSDAADKKEKEARAKYDLRDYIADMVNRYYRRGRRMKRR